MQTAGVVGQRLVARSPAEIRLRTALLRTLAVMVVALGAFYLTWRYVASLNLQVWWFALPFVAAVSSFGLSQLYRRSNTRDWWKLHVVRCGLDEEFLNAPKVPIPESNPPATKDSSTYYKERKRRLKG